MAKSTPFVDVESIYIYALWKEDVSEGALSTPR